MPPEPVAVMLPLALPQDAATDEAVTVGPAMLVIVTDVVLVQPLASFTVTV